MRLIYTEDAKPGMRLAQDVFTSEDSSVIYLRKGEILDDEKISRLAEIGTAQIIIESFGVNVTAHSSPVPASLLPPPLQSTKTVVHRAPPVISPELKKDAVDSLKATFEHFQRGDFSPEVTKKVINKMDALIDVIVTALTSDQHALVNIESLKSYDDYTYHHSLSVAVLSISIGQQMDFNGNDLRRLGLSAIMHDIGKTSISADIIRKPEKLTDEEFEIIRTHPVAGARQLSQSGIEDREILLSVLSHHEKYNGTGYPNRLSGDEIPMWSRIISVADVYDALTSSRPYRRPMPASDAFEYIMGGIHSFFDFDVVCALIHKVDVYPVGTCVELSDRRLALVVDNTNQLRPTVEILGTGEIIDLFNDTSQYSVVVMRGVPDTELMSLHPSAFTSK